MMRLQSGSCLLVLGCLLVATSADASERPDFSGTWQLNAELSQDLREKIQEAMRNRGGRPGRGAMGGGPREGGGERLAQIERGIETMTITQAEPELTIVYADERERVVYTDGRKWTRERPIGPVEVQGRWKRNKLVVKMKTERGGKITEMYEFLPDDARLHVTVVVEGRGRSFDYQRVYDLVNTQAHTDAGGSDGGGD